MTTPDHAQDNGDDHPVEVQEALDVPDDVVRTPPAEPTDQPSLPDFNT